MADAGVRDGGEDVSGGAPVRVGRIGFINCFPLYDHFEEELAARGFAADIVEGHPAALNALLVEGDIDVALPSSIEYARHADTLAVLPHVSISAPGSSPKRPASRSRRPVRLAW